MKIRQMKIEEIRKIKKEKAEIKAKRIEEKAKRLLKEAQRIEETPGQKISFMISLSIRSQGIFQ